MRWVIIAAITAVALFAWSLTRVSSDAVAMAIGMLLGVLAGMTTPALILLTRSEHDAPVTYIVQMPEAQIDESPSYLAYLVGIGEVNR